jgi:acetylornithine/succinyldiaminopimelate/putrescine aminotransferase
VLRFVPPLIVSEAEVDEAAQKLEKAITAVI